MEQGRPGVGQERQFGFNYILRGEFGGLCVLRVWGELEAVRHAPAPKTPIRCYLISFTSPWHSQTMASTSACILIHWSTICCLEAGYRPVSQTVETVDWLWECGGARAA